MKFKKSINTEIEITTVQNLPKLKILIEANNLGKPNFSAIARELNIDKRTVKKYYNGYEKKERKKKITKIDNFYEIISKLLSAESDQIFYYKSHLYRYFVREHNLDCSRSNFNHYILQHENFKEYFNPKEKKNSVKSETEFGRQAQFDWKENLKFTFTNEEKFTFNVGSLILSASRFKYWAICPSTSQSYLFDFLTNAFETIGGVPKEILVDNASSMMDKARTSNSSGKVNSKFQHLSEDYGFDIVPCIRARPNTKAKVENPMRIINEIMNYNGCLKNEKELYEKMASITEKVTGS